MLENPEASLQARLDFIRLAKQSIQIETFYLGARPSGKSSLKGTTRKKTAKQKRLKYKS